MADSEWTRERHDDARRMIVAAKGADREHQPHTFPGELEAALDELEREWTEIEKAHAALDAGNVPRVNGADDDAEPFTLADRCAILVTEVQGHRSNVVRIQASEARCVREALDYSGKLKSQIEALTAELDAARKEAAGERARADAMGEPDAGALVTAKDVERIEMHPDATPEEREIARLAAEVRRLTARADRAERDHAEHERILWAGLDAAWRERDEARAALRTIDTELDNVGAPIGPEDAGGVYTRDGRIIALGLAYANARAALAARPTPLTEAQIDAIWERYRAAHPTANADEHRAFVAGLMAARPAPLMCAECGTSITPSGEVAKCPKCGETYNRPPGGWGPAPLTEAWYPTIAEEAAAILRGETHPTRPNRAVEVLAIYVDRDAARPAPLTEAEARAVVMSRGWTDADGRHAPIVNALLSASRGEAPSEVSPPDRRDFERGAKAGLSAGAAAAMRARLDAMGIPPMSREDWTDAEDVTFTAWLCPKCGEGRITEPKKAHACPRDATPMTGFDSAGDDAWEKFVSAQEAIRARVEPWTPTPGARVRTARWTAVRPFDWPAEGWAASVPEARDAALAVLATWCDVSAARMP